MTPTQSIGIGCSSNATPEDILTLIHASIPTIFPATILATINRRAEIARTVAEALGINLLLYPAEVLAKIPSTLTTSQASLAHTGTPSIAEAAALAALGPLAHITLPRQTGHLCTCAVATIPSLESL
ncbi:cobalamin biosynthesis protein [Granulicella tundricola]|uniref:Precorrin-3B methylase n=1 Tax=Granulicella tundricola (strain ATCC BAA-1859 / DSM 23138 / MP5ACTX9) TaxID=1198114 RepID=E8X6S5_GRATM|nr:cobalamin biosynthesis protein [Granulicella tundricola]ADW71225.1 precorrin-3B methylase [Granulicella tundricola MP5ACTX9]